jgi:hypothetical protein
VSVVTATLRLERSAAPRPSLAGSLRQGQIDSGRSIIETEALCAIYSVPALRSLRQQKTCGFNAECYG